MACVTSSDDFNNASLIQRRRVLGGLAGTLATGAAWAQESFPNRPIRVIVPQPPGGGFDFVARTLADKIGQSFKSGIVVENRTGSGTLVGTDLAAKAAPDGYTVLTGSVSNMVLNVGLFKQLSYDPLKDFDPIGLAAAYSYTLVARKDLPLGSLAELVSYAKANPGRLSYASAGNGSGQHVLAAALWHLAGVQITHVPYRGAQPAYADLLGEGGCVFRSLSHRACARGCRQPQAVGGVGLPSLAYAPVGADLEGNRGGGFGVGILVWILCTGSYTCARADTLACRICSCGPVT